MAMLIATVRDNKTQEISEIASVYSSKKAFREDLARNGYSVIGRILDPKENTKRTRLYDKGCR